MEPSLDAYFVVIELLTKINLLIDAEMCCFRLNDLKICIEATVGSWSPRYGERMSHAAFACDPRSPSV